MSDELEPTLDVNQLLDAQRLSLGMDDDGFMSVTAQVYLITWFCADFELTIIDPPLEQFDPPVVIQPEKLSESDEVEFVYPIYDYGYKLKTSKASEMYVVGMSMCKLYFTIEKMISILIDRLKSGGVSSEAEVQIAFGGHELAQRKAFESVINLAYNVVVTNFDPGIWGERYLQIVKRLSDKGYGYPSSAPRDIYRVSRNTTPKPK